QEVNLDPTNLDDPSTKVLYRWLGHDPGYNPVVGIDTNQASFTDPTPPITITAPAGVEVSSDNGATYHKTLTLTATGDTLAPTVISARIIGSAAAGAITGKITDTTPGAAEQDVAVAGMVDAAATPTIVVVPAALNLGAT